jgi:hypothetical protein
LALSRNTITFLLALIFNRYSICAFISLDVIECPEEYISFTVWKEFKIEVDPTIFNPSCEAFFSRIGGRPTGLQEERLSDSTQIPVSSNA